MFMFFHFFSFTVRKKKNLDPLSDSFALIYHTGETTKTKRLESGHSCHLQTPPNREQEKRFLTYSHTHSKITFNLKEKNEQIGHASLSVDSATSCDKEKSGGPMRRKRNTGARRVQTVRQEIVAQRDLSLDTKKVFVGNLSWETTWQQLKDHMRSVGNVVHADVLKRRDGKSSGAGIVEYESFREAKRAIRELNDTEIDGRKILVREDREGSDGAKRTTLEEEEEDPMRNVSCRKLVLGRVLAGSEGSHA